MFFENRLGLKALFLFLFLSILLLVPAFAAPPSSSTTVQLSTGSLQLEYPKYDTIVLGDDHEFHVHVINYTASKTNRTTSCFIHLYNQTGFDADKMSGNMLFESNGVDYAFLIKANNFSLGHWQYVIQCNSSNEIGFASAGIDVIPKVVTTTSATSDWRIFIILVLLAMALLVFALHSENHIFSFLTGIVFGLSGMYSVIYGFDNVTDLYTRAIGIILLGIGGVLMALSVYGLMRENYAGGKDEFDD